NFKMEDVEMKNEENTETWLVNRARQCLTTDPYASKAWLLTARTLFPKNFSIQFEAYGIAKAEQDTKEAARLLEEMFTEFPDKEKLACELQSISNAVQCKTQENQFLKGVFENIPPEMQSKMLLKIGEQNKDIIEQARLMVLVLNTFPHLIQQHGLKLVDSLLFTEKHAHLHSSINCYRKYLVCDIMPIILRYQKLDAPVKHIQKWLQKSIEFYISYIAQPPSKDINTPMLKSPDLMSPTKTSFAAGSFKKLGIIPGLTESESVIATPWNSLFELLELFGQKLGWNIGNLYRLKSREAQWQHLVAMQQRGDTKETVYCGSVLFLECLILHASRVESDQFAATSSGPGLHPPLVLVETCSRNTSSTSSEPKSKKMKLDAGASIHISKTVPASLEVVQNFTTAFRCWQLLHSKESLEKELTKLLHYWKSENWPWLSNFETDCHLYQGEYREAIAKLENIKKSNANFSVLRADLQLASCYYCMGTYSKACEMLLNVIESLPHVTDSNQSQEEISPGSSHQLQLLSCTESDILPYCIKLIINCLKLKE
ncbi:unnamed protein product, partial [Owenia fusiformis]